MRGQPGRLGRAGMAARGGLAAVAGVLIGLLVPAVAWAQTSPLAATGVELARRRPRSRSGGLGFIGTCCCLVVVLIVVLIVVLMNRRRQRPPQQG